MGKDFEILETNQTKKLFCLRQENFFCKKNYREALL